MVRAKGNVDAPPDEFYFIIECEEEFVNEQGYSAGYQQLSSIIKWWADLILLTGIAIHNSREPFLWTS